MKSKLDKPVVKLSGEDGNVFSIIARVSKALKKAGMKEEAAEFVAKTPTCDDYWAVVALAAKYVEIE